MNLTFSYFILLHKIRVCFQFIFSPSRTISTIIIEVDAEDDGIGSMESNKEDSVRSLWKFCNSIFLPRSEVVFFTQATLIFFLVIADLLKLTLDRPKEKISVWFSLSFGAVGYILPNPKQ